MLKLLLTLGLVALLLWMAYRRLRPYIRGVQQFIGTVKGAFAAGSQTPSDQNAAGRGASSKLVRCAACSTWVPLNRALSADSLSYCSRACLQQAPKVRRKKMAS